MGAGNSSYAGRSSPSAAPVAAPVARAAAITCARLVPADDLLDVLDALGITDLARPPRTRKARR